MSLKDTADTIEGVGMITAPLGVSATAAGIVLTPLFSVLSESTRSHRMARVADNLTMTGLCLIGGGILFAMTGVVAMSASLALRNLDEYKHKRQNAD